MSSPDDSDSRLRHHRLVLHRAECDRISRGQTRIVPASPTDADEVPDVRRGLRWSCIGCGACCRERFAVQLDLADVARLEGVDLPGRLGLSLDQALIWPEGETRPWLRVRDGHCIFLGRDGLCDVHRAFGARTKPTACQAFPFEPLRTPHGPLLRYRPECSGQVDTDLDGAPVDPARAASTWRELMATCKGQLSLPQRVRLAGDAHVDWSAYVALEASWIERATADGWCAALDQMHTDLTAAAEDDLDYAPDEIAVVLLLAAGRRRAVAQLVRTRSTKPLGELVDGGATPDDCRSLVATVFEVLRRSVSRLPDWPRLGDDDTDIADPLRAAPPWEAVALDARRVDEVCAATARLLCDARVERVLVRYLADALFGKYAFHAETIAAGRALLELVVAAAVISASWAHLEHGRTLDAAAVNEALIVWHLQVFGHSALRVELQLALGSVVESVRLADGLATWLAAHHEHA